MKQLPMVFRYLRMNIEIADEDFNGIYPESIQQLAKRHWTPVEVAKQAAEFLATFPGAKILDIGSGAGKFCLVGASSTHGKFIGIEQRKNLVDLSIEIATSRHLKNVQFIHANITEINFSDYNAFYFYNSFQENLEPDACIDTSISTEPIYYRHYSDYVSSELAKKPIGTRLVTYWSSLSEVPSNYKLQYATFEGRLKFWEKTG